MILGPSRGLAPGAILIACAFAPVANVVASHSDENGLALARFALIIGVNRSVDAELQALQYADDDAARYFDLFRALGTRVHLLSRFDDNTRRLHPSAAAAATLPRERELEDAVRRVARDIAAARQRGTRSVLYAVYAGHGNVSDGRAYITLEDRRIAATRLDKLLRRLNADLSHVVIDACYAYFFAHDRGPGGARRAAPDFRPTAAVLSGPRTGVILSSSTESRTHEWSALQAGVFSHELRSAIYGAADADDDRRITYREIAAFVERANQRIPNERFRPRVYARPPDSTATFLSISASPSHGLVAIGSAQHGRYTLEDRNGVRLADFHSGAGQKVKLVRPRAAEPLYLRRAATNTEFELPLGPLVDVSTLVEAPPRAVARGPLHHAFRRLFALPFDRTVVESFRVRAAHATVRQLSAAERPSTWRRRLGWGTVGLGVAALVTGGAFALSAQMLDEPGGVARTQPAVSSYNASLKRRRSTSYALLAGGGAATVVGLLMALWPAEPSPRPVLVFDGQALFASGSF